MMRAFGKSIILVAALSTVGACTGRVRVYDEPHHDYHRWDSHEEAQFRIYLGERHMEYRKFDRLNAAEQRDYWAWRHNHPDR